MRAVCWNGKKDVRVETVPDPSTAKRPAAFSVIRTLLGGYAGGQAEYVRVPFADSRICVHLKQ